MPTQSLAGATSARRIDSRRGLFSWERQRAGVKPKRRRTSTTVNAVLEAPSNEVKNRSQIQMTFRSTVLIGSLLALALLHATQLPAKSITDRDRDHWAFHPL
jgi:hypothetical protein